MHVCKWSRQSYADKCPSAWLLSLSTCQVPCLCSLLPGNHSQTDCWMRSLCKAAKADVVMRPSVHLQTSNTGLAGVQQVSTFFIIHLLLFNAAMTDYEDSFIRSVTWKGLQSLLLRTVQKTAIVKSWPVILQILNTRSASAVNPVSASHCVFILTVCCVWQVTWKV